MKYTELGKTGIKNSLLGFGGIPIQRGNAADAKGAVYECIEQGINYIDTARGYTTSEAFLGEALEGIRDKFYLASKSMVRDYEGMKKEVMTSINNMKCDYLDLYQLHNIPVNEFDLVFSDKGAYKALEELKEEGLIKHIGATAHSLEALKKLVEEYDDKIETVMFPFNIVETQGLEVLKMAHEKGIGTIAMKPLAGGNITDTDLAIRYIMDSDIIDIILIGMGNDEEVKMNASCDFDKKLDDKDQEKILGIRKELGNTFCRRCGYCGPCTVGISIPNVFLFANYLRHYEGLANWAMGRYSSLAVKADACVECGLCETRCPYNLPIRDMLKKADEDFKKAGVK